eukprot:CAMPEP_0171502824 /NCGR_PEP_ID=MMETSP0958-20121227/10448_1 /TAXON_ID=87120 /ORGANISM="Aurantiochytrium limacinum, Strain ATCCMYA-1381" /LENGTH=61 /DNA_ID=CAMNT_0012038033 /DNA_START=55 /DNA_END=240 /DNA_ORIENTATION=+
MAANDAASALVAAYPKVESACTSGLNLFKQITFWAFVPAVILLGIRVSEPKPTLVDILSPF